MERQVDHEDGGLVLEIINLPEAMKLHTENVFEGVLVYHLPAGLSV